MTFDAVLFDCDGVIVDSEDATREMLRHELASYGVNIPPRRMDALFTGGTMHRVFDTARGLGADLPEGWVEDFYERLYARLGQGTALIPGIEGVLDALDMAGIPYAVGSNGTERKMHVTLGQHPALLDRLRGRIFSGQALGCPKPDPGLYLHAADALGAAPNRCAVIEDSAPGCRAAARAGMACFGYAPVGNGAALAAEGAHVFDSMDTLPGLLATDRPPGETDRRA